MPESQEIRQQSEVINIAKYKLTPEQLNSIDKSEWLTDRQRTIFELCYKRGWKRAEVAAEIEIDISTVYRELAIIRSKGEC